MELLGRTSLFIYWVHVELVYGLPSRPLHKALSFNGALVAFAIFTMVMLGAGDAQDEVLGSRDAVARPCQTS